MQSTAPRLRPLSLGDLLDATFALYRENFALFAGIVATLVVPETLLLVLLDATVGPLTTVVGLVVGLIFTQMITGALAIAISHRYLGRPISIGESYLQLGGLIRPLVFGAILYGLFVGVGFVLLVIPGIYLLVRLVFFSQAIAIERMGISEAFSRSMDLVRGSWWRVFGYVIVLSILVAVLQGVVTGVASVLLSIGGTGSRIVSTILSELIGILVRPIQMIGLTLLYYDLRIRKEGFDIEHLNRSMEGHNWSRDS